MENLKDGQMQNRPRKDVSGCHNPMYGRRHSEASRNKMSQAATLRNQQYRDALRNQHHVTMDEFLSNNPSVEEYIKQLAKNVVKEQIDLLIWNRQKKS
jgi:hypothetical protein